MLRPPLPPLAAIWRLHIAGSLLAVIYAALSARFLFLPSVDLTMLPLREQGDSIFLILREAGLSALPLYVGVAGLLSGAYFVAWRAVRHLEADRGVLVAIFGWAAVFGVLVVAMQPILSRDILDYAFRGRQFVVHGLSPLVYAATATPTDPWVQYLAWPELPTPYGPLWLVVEIVGWWLGHGELLATVASLKLIGLVAYLAASVLVWRILALTMPAHILTGTLLLAWNPLIVLEWIGNGHNDAVMMTLVLLSLWALARDRWHLALPALTAAVLVKASAVLLLPLVVLVAVRHWRHERMPMHRIAVGAVIAVTLAIGAYAWLWSGTETLLHVVRMNDHVSVANSLGYTLMRVATRFAGIDAALSIPFLRQAGYLVFVVCYGLIAVRVWHTPSALTRSWFDVTFAFLLVGTAWFWPWYVAWIVVGAAVLTDRRRQHAAIAYSITALLMYGVADWRLPVAPYLGYAIVVLFGHVVPAALFVYALVMERRDARPTPPAIVLQRSPLGQLELSRDDVGC